MDNALDAEKQADLKQRMAAYAKAWGELPADEAKAKLLQGLNNPDGMATGLERVTAFTNEQIAERLHVSVERTAEIMAFYRNKPTDELLAQVMERAQAMTSETIQGFMRRTGEKIAQLEG